MAEFRAITEELPASLCWTAPAEMPTQSMDSYWVGLANAYAGLCPPLRPSLEDIRFLEDIVDCYVARHASDAKQALLLGVTPDIATMRWPAPLSLLAIDKSTAMAKAVWPGNVPGKRWAVCGCWHLLPQRECSVDLIIGDGSINCLRYPDEYREFARNMQATLKPDGILILRCFAQPEVQEQPEEVLESALRGDIPTFTQFKFRLLMALERNAREGIAVNRVYRFWAAHKSVEPALISCAGWRKDEINTIELYRDAITVHTFPTLTESRAILAEFFDEILVSFPSYYDGDRCPRMVLTPRRSRG